ncbi:hypothetical protein Efla_007316 [Eimeria flavescens]
MAFLAGRHRISACCWLLSCPLVLRSELRQLMLSVALSLTLAHSASLPPLCDEARTVAYKLVDQGEWPGQSEVAGAAVLYVPNQPAGTGDRRSVSGFAQISACWVLSCPLVWRSELQQIGV